MYRKVRVLLVALVALGGLAVALPVQEAGEKVVKRGTIDEDLYLVGGEVDVAADVTGDVVAAGGVVRVTRRVDGDVMVAGGDVEVGATVLDDVRAAGGNISLRGEISDDAIAAGGNVQLVSGARVGGRGWFAGGNVEVAGDVGRGLKAAGEVVTVLGTVEGDAEITADRVVIGPSARITGNLTYRSPEPAEIDSAAQVAGDILRQRVERRGLAGGILIRALFLTGTAVLGIALLLLFPGFAVSAARTVERRPGTVLVAGLAVLIGAPIAAAVSIITVIGIGLGLVLLLVYGLTLVAGYLTAAFFLGDLGARKLLKRAELSLGARVVALLVGLVALALLRGIPILGFLVMLAALIFGVGALSVSTYRSYTSAGGSAGP